MPMRTNVSGNGGASTYISGQTPAPVENNNPYASKILTNQAGFQEATMPKEVTDGSVQDGDATSQKNISGKNTVGEVNQGKTYAGDGIYPAWNPTGQQVDAAIKEAIAINDAEHDSFYLTSKEKIVDVNYDGSRGASDGTIQKPYTTIQAAINSCAATGNVIKVIAGIYNEATIDFDARDIVVKLNGKVTISTTDIISSDNLKIIGIADASIIQDNLITFAAGGEIAVAGNLLIENVTLVNGIINITDNCELNNVKYNYTSAAAGNLITTGLTCSIKNSAVTISGAFDFTAIDATSGILIQNSQFQFSTAAIGAMIKTTNEEIKIYNSFIQGNAPTMLLIQFPVAALTEPSILFGTTLVNGTIDGNSGYFTFDESNKIYDNAILVNITNIIADRLIANTINLLASYCVVPNARIVIDGDITILDSLTIAQNVKIEWKSGAVSIGYDLVHTITLNEGCELKDIPITLISTMAATDINYFTIAGNNVAIKNCDITFTGNLPAANTKNVFYFGSAINGFRLEETSVTLLDNTIPNVQNQKILDKTANSCSNWYLDINILGLTADYTTAWNGFLLNLRNTTKCEFQNILLNYAISFVDATHAGINLSSCTFSAIGKILNLSIYTSSLLVGNINELTGVCCLLTINLCSINRINNAIANAIVTINSSSADKGADIINYLYVGAVTAITTISHLAIQDLIIKDGNATIVNCSINNVFSRGVITINNNGFSDYNSVIENIDSDNSVGTLIINAPNTTIGTIQWFNSIEFRNSNNTTINVIKAIDITTTITFTTVSAFSGIRINNINSYGTGNCVIDLTSFSNTYTNFVINNATALTLIGISRTCTNLTFNNSSVLLNYVNGVDINFNNCVINRSALGIFGINGTAKNVNITNCFIGSNINRIDNYGTNFEMNNCTGTIISMSHNSQEHHGTINSATGLASFDLATNELINAYYTNRKVIYQPGANPAEIRDIASNTENEVTATVDFVNAPILGDRYGIGEEVGIVSAPAVNNIVIVGANFPVNAYANYLFTVVLGIGVIGERRRILSNTTNTLVLDSDLSAPLGIDTGITISAVAENSRFKNIKYTTSNPTIIDAYGLGFNNSFKNVVFTKPTTIIGQNNFTIKECEFIGNVTFDIAKVFNVRLINNEIIGNVVQSAVLPGIDNLLMAQNDIIGTVTFTDLTANSSIYANYISNLVGSAFSLADVTGANR